MIRITNPGIGTVRNQMRTSPGWWRSKEGSNEDYVVLGSNGGEVGEVR